MPRRVRTTKTVARRIDLQYFKGRHPFRSWRLWLSVLVPVVAVVWFVSARASGQKVLSSGPLSASHAAFGRRCEVCHVTKDGEFRKQVSDTACLTCHDAPAHHPQKVAFTPACGSCHLEHQGAVRLARTMDSSCAQCHTDLRVKTGELKYVSNIHDFDDHHHPEFAVWRLEEADPGKIKLNHYAHLQPKLASPNGPVQMTCHDCHRPAGAEGTWPYAAQMKTAAASGGMPGSVSAASDTSVGDASSPSIVDQPRTARPRAYMAQILYATQCAACHVKDLQFDKRFDEVAPHDKPDVVQAFLVKKYTEYIAAHPNALSQPLPVSRILNSPWPPMPPPPHTHEEWIAWQVAFADRLLFDKGCKLCHTMLYGAGPIPAVAKSAIPVRWLQHADFDHDAHRFLTCTACHAAAPQSRQTADILLPRIKTCQDCHQEAGAMHDAADGRCSECHAYHEWGKEQPQKGTYTIVQSHGSAAGVQ